MDLRQLLNDAQYEAVTTLDGPVLVIAGAGSGKTRVIEYRSLQLVRQGVNPSSILLLTFTRRAAGEMIGRASRHDSRCRDIDGGTFHSFAYRMLKRYAKSIGFEQDIVVLDESDSQEAIHRCASALELYSRDKRFPKKETLKNIISMAVNRSSTIAEVVKRDYPHFVEHIEDIKKVAIAYSEYKIKRGYIDYDDMLIYLKVMLENEQLHSAIASRYSHIMVDEFQDTNRLQADIASLLASPTGNIMVVGDDAQSIYGFRGAVHKNIIGFPERFPNCKVIRLERNYRSTQSILNCANALLETMKEKYQKCLTAANDDFGQRPSLLFFKNPYDEAEWIAQSIKEALDEGLNLSQIAVLCRSMYLTIPLQTELSKRNIPYETYGGLKFYETAHVKDLLSHLKVMVNLRDELAWHRLLMLVDGIGLKTSERLTNAIISTASMSDAIGLLSEHSKRMKNSAPLNRLIDAFETAKVLAKKEVGALYDVFFEYYRPLMKTRFDDWHLRINDLEMLRQIASTYTAIDEMLTDFALEPPERGVWAREPETKDGDRPLTLSTIHSAKGLEWDRVFLIGLIDGVLPSSFSLDNEEDLEEEKRLLYVAITRAKRRLYLSMHHQGKRQGISQFNRLCRFLTPLGVRQCLDLEDEAIVRGGKYNGSKAMTIGLDNADLLKRVLEHYR